MASIEKWVKSSKNRANFNYSLILKMQLAVLVFIIGFGCANDQRKPDAQGPVIPFIEKKYRVIPDRKSRALAGLSMPGGQSFYTGLRNLDIFGSVATFSSGIFGGPVGLPQNFDAGKEIPGILSDAQSFNNQLEVFYISVGENDPRFESTKTIVKTFEEHGLEVKFNSFPGAHDFQVWRKSLNTFASILFKD
jgi:enterochelin esterase family protein